VQFFTQLPVLQQCNPVFIGKDRYSPTTLYQNCKVLHMGQERHLILHRMITTF